MFATNVFVLSLSIFHSFFPPFFSRLIAAFTTYALLFITFLLLLFSLPLPPPYEYNIICHWYLGILSFPTCTTSLHAYASVMLGKANRCWPATCCKIYCMCLWACVYSYWLHVSWWMQMHLLQHLTSFPRRW